MFQAFNTDDFLEAVDEFDRRVREGRKGVVVKRCRPAGGSGDFQPVWWQRPLGAGPSTHAAKPFKKGRAGLASASFVAFRPRRG